MSDFSVQFDDTDVLEFSSGSADDSVKEQKTDKVTKAVKVIFGILLFVFMLEIVIYKFAIPSLSSPKVLFSGNKSYTARELVTVLTPINTSNWFNFDIEQAVSLLASVSGIDSVSVKKQFPNKIYINVIERSPVAMVFINDNGKCVPLHVDENGVLFPEKTVENSYSIPIISGLPIEHYSAGMRVPVKYRALISQVANIAKMPQNYFKGISEICVVPKDYGNYELILIPAKSRIKVFTDRTLNEDSLKYMMLVLDVLNKVNYSVSEIDLRYGSVSYRKK